MTTSHHPDDATLMAHAAGSLPAALAAVVAAHVAACPRCARAERFAEAVGGALIEGLAPAPLVREAPQPARPMAPVPSQCGDGDIPQPLRPLLGPSLARLAWRRLAPGLEGVELGLAGPPASTLLVLRAAGGASIPDHGHDGSELTLVLSGGYSDATGHYVAGDVADLDGETSHAPVADPEGCVCVVAFDGWQTFKSPLVRAWRTLRG